MCVDSKNVIEMSDKAKAGLLDSRGGFEELKSLTIKYPNVILFYENRRCNGEVDALAKQGM